MVIDFASLYYLDFERKVVQKNKQNNVLSERN